MLKIKQIEKKSYLNYIDKPYLQHTRGQYASIKIDTTPITYLTSNQLYSNTAARRSE